MNNANSFTPPLLGSSAHVASPLPQFPDPVSYTVTLVLYWITLFGIRSFRDSEHSSFPCSWSDFEFVNQPNRECPHPVCHIGQSTSNGVTDQRLPFVFTPSDWQYNMSGKKYMHIFNNHEFKDTIYFCGKPSTLYGTEYDEKMLRGVFTKFGFSVQVHENKDYDEIYDIVSELSTQDHSGTSCVCLAVLSHGGEGGMVAAADKPYEISKLLGILQYGDGGLVGKPKILLAQACRGNKYDIGRVQLDSCNVRSIVLPTHADTLVLYSSVEGHLSWGHMDGSWLFKELCYVLNGAHKELDLLQMTSIVSGFIARHYETYVDGRPDLGKVKQMPEVHSTLTKLLRFREESKK